MPGGAGGGIEPDHGRVSAEPEVSLTIPGQGGERNATVRGGGRQIVPTEPPAARIEARKPAPGPDPDRAVRAPEQGPDQVVSQTASVPCDVPVAVDGSGRPINAIEAGAQGTDPDGAVSLVDGGNRPAAQGARVAGVTRQMAEGLGVRIGAIDPAVGPDPERPGSILEERADEVEDVARACGVQRVQATAIGARRDAEYALARADPERSVPALDARPGRHGAGVVARRGARESLRAVEPDRSIPAQPHPAAPIELKVIEMELVPLGRQAELLYRSALRHPD